MRGRDRPRHNFPNLKSDPEIGEPAPEISDPDIPDRYLGYHAEKPETSLENSGIYLWYPNILNYSISRKGPI